MRVVRTKPQTGLNKDQPQHSPIGIIPLQLYSSWNKDKRGMPKILSQKQLDKNDKLHQKITQQINLHDTLQQIT